jgi:hypothetical protein
MIKRLAIVMTVASFSVLAAKAQIVATDDYETGTIAYGYNGGSGYGALTYLNGGSGGVYGSNSSTDNRQIDGNQSLGIDSGGGSQTAGRALTTSVTNGIYSVDVRFDINNGNGSTFTDPFTGLGIFSGLALFTQAPELLRFGLTGASNSKFLIADASGPHSLSVGTDTELRGGIFNFTVAFNTVADSYILTVTDKGNGQTGSISGSLEGASPGAVAAIEFLNSDAEGGNQNLIVDNTVIEAVPEPSTIAAGVLAVIGAFFLRRRRATA